MQWEFLLQHTLSSTNTVAPEDPQKTKQRNANDDNNNHQNSTPKICHCKK